MRSPLISEHLAIESRLPTMPKASERKQRKLNWHSKDIIRIQRTQGQPWLINDIESSHGRNRKIPRVVHKREQEGKCLVKSKPHFQFNEVPAEILSEILSYVDISHGDLLSFRYLCRNMNDATLFEIKKKVKFRLSERYYIAPQLNSSISSANVVRQYVLLHNLRGGYGFYGVCIRCGLFDSSSVEGRLKNGSISVCRECFTPDINDSFKRNVRTLEELEQTRMALGDINYNDWILEPPWIYERDKRWVTFTDMKDFIEDWYDLAITLVQIGYEWKVVSG